MHPTANIDRRAKISPEAVVGAHAGVGEGSVLGGEVHLGDHVTMGPYCYFITGHHPIPPDFLEFRDMTATHRKIVVGSGVFIGGRVTVLPGVSIGRGAAIGAGSVVAKDVPAGAIVVGNPAQIIRQRQV
ncbi:acyltransferase [Dietzia cercidiphylli]|uniref:acyltransferase n=1 Tax=Dietzia cercidiphylli TaxID=498199 RepID=UPI0021F083FA|nr:DapH/DapD/GlmU-related protein [Dietzia cercidiphylli]MCT1516952.1 hypothetical protein [Dietzia cercidiphylli]